MQLIQDNYGSKNEWTFEFSDKDNEACDALNELLDKELPDIIKLKELDMLANVYPCDVDILHHIAVCYYNLDLVENNRYMSFIYQQAATSLALQAIPSMFNWNNSKINDLSINNRPFFRAYATLAGRYKELGEVKECKKICERILSLAPRDGHGLRYLLVDIYQNEKNSTALKKIIEKYPNEDLLENAKKEA